MCWRVVKFIGLICRTRCVGCGVKSSVMRPVMRLTLSVWEKHTSDRGSNKGTHVGFIHSYKNIIQQLSAIYFNVTFYKYIYKNLHVNIRYIIIHNKMYTHTHTHTDMRGHTGCVMSRVYNLRPQPPVNSLLFENQPWKIEYFNSKQDLIKYLIKLLRIPNYKVYNIIHNV